MHTLALTELLFKIADDELIYGHRNSEWIGLGPLLEEDISFASIAQDKVGQSRVLYNLLHTLGQQHADELAFLRTADQYKCCHLVELPCPDYAQALVRHFLFDEAEAVRFHLLKSSSNTDLAAFARKFSGEIKYHTLHGRSIVQKLMKGSSEAAKKLVAAFAELLPYCGGIFELGPFEEELIQTGVFAGERVAHAQWLGQITPFLSELGIAVARTTFSHIGGRYGEHTEHLVPLLDEMSEVFKLDPTAEW